MSNEMQEILDRAKKTADPPLPTIPDPLLTEVSDEALNVALIKRMGVGLEGLVKKEENKIPLTDAQIKEAAEKKENDILKFGLDQNIISAKDNEEYISLINADNIEIARQKFIEQNPELGEDASAVFDSTFRLDEDDEIENGENVKVPNREKIAARKLVDKLADEVRNIKTGKVKSLPKLFEQHQENEALKIINASIIEKGLSAVPKKIELEESFTIEGEETPITLKVGIDLTDADITAARELVTNGALTKKGLTEDEVKINSASFLLTAHTKRLVAEALSVGYRNGVADEKRGAKGLSRITVVDGGGPVVTDGHKVVEAIKNSS